MNYINWNPSPEIINLFGISIRYYSVLFAIGLALGYKVVINIYDREKISIADLERLALYIFVGTILGARLGHCLFYDFEYFWNHPLEIFLPFKGTIGKDFHFTGFTGLASHGGAIGVLIAIILFSKKSKINIWDILDLIAVGVPIAASFIRLGNLMNSEIVGKVTDVRWAFIFNKVDGLPRHPTQLYEAIAYFIIFLVMLMLFKHKKKRLTQSGFIFGVFLILMFAARMILEFYKVNQVGFEDNLVLNMGQILSIPFISIGIIIVILKRKVTIQSLSSQ